MNIRNHVNKIKIGAVVCSILSLILLCPCERVSAYEITDSVVGNVRVHYANPRFRIRTSSGDRCNTNAGVSSSDFSTSDSGYGFCVFGEGGEYLGGWGGGQIVQFTIRTGNNGYVNMEPQGIGDMVEVLSVESVARTDNYNVYNIIARLKNGAWNGYGIPIPLKISALAQQISYTSISMTIWWGASSGASNQDIVDAIHSLNNELDLTNTNNKIDNVNNTIQNRYEEEDNATEDAQSNAQSGAEDAGQQATEDAGNLIQGAQALINALNTSTGTDCIISGNLYDGIFNLGNLNLCLNKPSWWDNIANIVGSLVFAPAIYWWGRRVLEKMLALYDRMQK